MARPKTLTIQYMVLFSHLTVQLPEKTPTEGSESRVERTAGKSQEIESNNPSIVSQCHFPP